MLFWTNSWWAFHVRQATPVELIPILFIYFAIQRPNLSDDQENVTEKVSKPPEQRFVQYSSSSPLIHCSPVLTLFGLACTSSTWYAPICYVSFSLLNNQPVPNGSLYVLDGVGCVLLNNLILSRPNKLNICRNDPSHKLFWWWNTMQSTPQGPSDHSSVTNSIGHDN